MALWIKKAMLPLSSHSFCLAHFVGQYPAVGFSGSRLVGSVGYQSASRVVPLLGHLPCVVGVGCARGVDQLVRSVFPLATVFRVQSPINRGAFARRSVRLVQWVQASGGVLVVFPSVPCPSQVRPSSSFAGYGSGSWGSTALGVGLGVPVLVVVPWQLGWGQFPAPFALASRFVCVGASPVGSFWLAK